MIHPLGGFIAISDRFIPPSHPIVLLLGWWLLLVRCVRCGGALPPIGRGRAASVRRERPFLYGRPPHLSADRVLVALISALDSAVLRQRRFVKAENALKQEQKEKPATTDIVDNGNPDKIQGAEDGGPNSDETKSQEKEGTEANSKKTEMPEIRGAEALAQKGTAPLLLKHEMDELIKGETNTRKKRQSSGLARGDNVEKMPNKFDLTLPKYDPSKSAVKAAEYKAEFDRNNTPVDYDGKEKKCKVKADIDIMSEDLKTTLKENGADQRDINAAEDGCGLKGYAEWSRCSKVAFYGRDGYNASKKYGIEQAEPPTKNFNDMDEFDKYGFMHDTVLLLFDGCAVCNGNKVPNVTISLLQHMPTGLLVDECKEFVNRSGKPLKLKMEMVEKQQKSTGSFAYGVPLMERLCSEKKPDTDKDEYYMQKLEYKYRVVLEVNHTCGADGEHKTHYIWLPEIDVFDQKTVVGRVMQIRQLKLDFADMDDTVDLTFKLSGSEFDKSGQFVKATLIPYKSEPVVPPPPSPNPMVPPIATNVNHLGVKCTQIVFSDFMPQFFLNVSNSVYAIACQKFLEPIGPGKFPGEFSASDYLANACAKVPTTLTCNKDHELIGCYKTKKVKHVVNNEIAEVCQKHLGNVGQQQAHGFRIRFCAKRHTTEQLISAESILDFTFSDKIYKREHGSYSYKSGELSAMRKTAPFFFIEFGNEKHHSILRGKGYGDELSADLRLTIGTILPSIALEPPSSSSSPNNGGGAQHRTKLLHFVPAASEELDVFFQTRFPIFSQRIIRKTNLLPYENNPNKTIPDKCDLLGNDCEATREILLQIQDVLQCCSPFNPWSRCLCDGSNSVDKSEFAAPPGEKQSSAPDKTPSSSSSNSSSRWAHLGDPLYGSDIFYTKETAQKRYDDIMEIAEQDYNGRLKAIQDGKELIEKHTCVSFTIDFNKMADEGIEVIDDGRNWSSAGRNYTTVWQELSLGENSVRLKGTAGHELLHALALAHEMNRDDAFYFIKLNPSNRDKDWIENYEPLNKTDNFGFPYDFGSLMHYWAYIKNGYYDLITMGRFYQRTIGQRERLSFRDSAIINHIYCGDNCKGKKNECQNGGYLNPKQCDECLCPEGYGGAHCDQLEQNQNCVDLSGTPNNLEADWQIRKLKPRPKKGEKVIIKLNKPNDFKDVSDCPEICGTTHVEIKYRKDKRARGALICCANDILRQNFARNWIEAEEKDVDIIISGRLATTDEMGFELTYETDGAKLLPSCDCTSPYLLFDLKRSPGYYCEPPCKPDSTCKTPIGGCGFGFLALNDKVQQNASGPLNVSCHKREGSAESFWYYWKQKDIEPIRIEEVHCVPCDREKDKGCKYKP
ncbi:hypothetical protein niasHT_003643 [Heterodera trifolii]|uniref:Metalloendopeptidase n=1 Tax=Heterodera trifolii TaxID=157864 RepID=A0ABD2MEW6_9BILA